MCLGEIFKCLPPKRSLVGEIHRRFIAFCQHKHEADRLMGGLLCHT